MNEIARLFVGRVVSGLKRKSLQTCSRWACEYRVMGQPFPGPWRFTHHPWLREMHDAGAEMCVGQKSAQMGYSEWALNRSLYKIDVEGASALYILPARTPHASEFSASRFDAALESSPHLAQIFSDVRNVFHKRAGSANLFIRGSRSRTDLKSVPAGFVVMDEVDEFVQANIPLVWERMAGQTSKQSLLLSTPTVDNYGINKYFKDSTQEHFFFPCPRCGRLTELTYPECLVVTAEELTDPRLKESYLRCKECEGRLDHGGKPEWLAGGVWVPKYEGRDARGFHVNQLYSCTRTPAELAASSIRAKSDPADEQEFYNSNLGLTHAAKGSRVTDADLSRVTRAYARGPVATRNIITMGVDVGRWLHCEIDEWFTPPSFQGGDINTQAKPRVLDQLKFLSFDELDLVMRQYGVWFAVIDAQPERRKSLEFCNRWPGRAKMAFYGNGVVGKAIHVSREDDPNVATVEPTATVDRTSWLDLSLGRFRGHDMIELPVDTLLEYRDHIKSPVRVYKKDKSGNPFGVYVEAGGADHFAHARNYAEIAFVFAVSTGSAHDISNVY